LIGRVEDGGGKSGDIEKMEDLCANILGRTVCPLGDAAVMPIQSAIKLFRDEWEYHIEHKKCIVESKFEFK
jgi:NADH-quinone oxidoreductase subunit F